MNKAFSVFVIFLLNVSMVQAEWFKGGTTSYKTLDGKWRKATIHITNGFIRIYSKKDRSLVAVFQKSGYEKEKFYRSWKRMHYTGEGLAGAAALVGLLALPEEPGWVSTCSYSDCDCSCTTYWTDGRDPVISAKSALISIGVMSGFAATIFLWPPKPTEYTFQDGFRNVTVRIRKRDRERFEKVF